MAKNKLIHLTSNDWDWLIIGVVLGVILTFLLLYLYTYLPKLTEIQRTGLSFTLFGGILGYGISKFEWENEKE